MVFVSCYHVDTAFASIKRKVKIAGLQFHPDVHV
jgi:hypothetical protein